MHQPEYQERIQTNARSCSADNPETIRINDSRNHLRRKFLWLNFIPEDRKDVVMNQAREHAKKCRRTILCAGIANLLINKIRK